MLVPHESILALNHDLAATGQFHAAEMADIRGSARLRVTAGLCGLQRFGHVSSRVGRFVDRHRILPDGASATVLRRDKTQNRHRAWSEQAWQSEASICRAASGHALEW
jgi:hypothetical protein